ncbi:replicative DNA helicase [Streptomyces sp. URMC 125]|uniref:replicative DNA helicase n=1 Tax=Streptomyces sp. URMC 125 TaxID=3423419 RepID=UPI003F1DD580
MSVPSQSTAPATEQFDRIPPQDLDAEQSVLGGMLLSKDAIADVTEILTGSEFYRPAHQTIYRATCDLYAAGEPADPITVAAELTRRGEIGKVGGPGYLHSLVQAVPTAANAAYYAEIVQEKDRLRQVVETGTRITQLGYAQGADAQEVVDHAASELLGLSAGFDLGRDPEGWDAPMGDLLTDWEDDQASGPAPGLPMPYAELAEMLGTEAGHLVVIAGRPGMGKSVTLLDIVRHLAIVHDKRAVFVSLEMMRRQLMNRLVAAEATIPLHQLRKHQLDADHWARYHDSRARIAAAPLALVVPPGGITLSQMRARLRKWAIEGRLPAALAVDYLQIIKPETTTKYGNRTGEVDAIARGLKELAIEFALPVIAAAQLSRQTTSRDSKIPVLSDLRESGEIEQAADAVVLLHREDYYEPAHERAGELDLIVAKNRNGTTGTCTVAWQGRFSRAVDFETP